jgi:MoCo/4Fe-4S cofactor protein with predicted Tat translocation signal
MSQHHDKPDSGFAPDEQGGGFVPLTSLRRAAPRLDIAAIRERLKNARGRQYWQSLEELSDSPEFHRYIEREFPNAAPRDMKPLHRREFLRVMGATMALAGVAGCGYQPAEKIVPYVEAPEDLVPGKPLFFTTAFQRSGYGYGILGESHMGRPIKLEGNPKHPASLGATDLFGQASLLGLYDPDRSQTARYLANLSTLDSFQGALAERVPELRKNRGAGLRILVESFTSPTLAWQLRKLLQLYPQARIHHHDPAGRDNVRAGTRKAFGTEVNPVYHFDRATVVLSLDSNFLVEEPGSVRYARELPASSSTAAASGRTGRR